MFVEIFSICDAATDYAGRLNLLGAFEGIAAPSAPILRDRCSIALRIRFDVAETGDHDIEISFLNKDRKVVGPVVRAPIKVKIHAGRESGAHNLVLNINRLQFPDFGTYRITLVVDGEEQSYIPLLVAQTQKRNRMRGTMEN